MNPKFIPVYVEWEDSESPKDHWLSTEDFEDWANSKPAICHTTGYLTLITDDFIVVSGTYHDDEIGDSIKIPTSAVRAVSCYGTCMIHDLASLRLKYKNLAF